VTVEYMVTALGGGHIGVTVIISVVVDISKTVDGTQPSYPALQITTIPKNSAAIEN